jgi:PAS domain S-box-containing protein
MISLMKKQASDKFFNVILHSIADGVFTTDSEGKITFFNKAAEEITGFTSKEALGRFCFDIFRADICQSRCALKETIRTKKEIINLPVTVLNKKGKKLPISISTASSRERKDHRRRRNVQGPRQSKNSEGASTKIYLGDIISKNHQMHEIFNILPNIAESDSTVLIQGASGQGRSFRKSDSQLEPSRKPFVGVNCGRPKPFLNRTVWLRQGRLPMRKRQARRFALANGGTIFLDEIGDMSPPLQAKLLRVLQEKEYDPLGSVSPRKTDVRVIAATNKDLSRLVSEGKFRDDLYYRVNVVKIELPPLSQRREDIPLLIDAFINKFNARMEKQITGVTDHALRRLMSHEYPGNVRELENVIEHAFVICRGTGSIWTVSLGRSCKPQRGNIPKSADRTKVLSKKPKLMSSQEPSESMEATGSVRPTS